MNQLLYKVYVHTHMVSGHACTHHGSGQNGQLCDTTPYQYVSKCSTYCIY